MRHYPTFRASGELSLAPAPLSCHDALPEGQSVTPMIAPPSEVGVEEIVANLVMWLKLVIEAIGALVIGVGMILASLRFTRGSFPPTARRQI